LPSTTPLTQLNKSQVTGKGMVPLLYQRNIMANTETKTRADIKLAEPPMFKIIYMNDDETPIDFVIGSLIEHFNYTAMAAEQITMSIHSEGAAVVAVLPYELAEQKGGEITIVARTQGYPLKIKLEPETV
jgi:ATP-dependent Clp protease adaptor protein ClpS